MKSPTFPATQQERRIALRDIVFPKAIAEYDNGHTDLNNWVSPCGTTFCLLGWYLHLIEGLNGLFEIGDRVEALEPRARSDYDPVFGFGFHVWHTLFSGPRDESPRGDLQRRFKLLQRVMETS